VAALAHWFQPEVVDLREVNGGQMEGVLAEELVAWQREFHWDYSPSTELVRRYVDMGSLSGFALRQAGQVVGYAYYINEDHKGLIGGLYIQDAHSTLEGERALLRASLEALRVGDSRLRRIESQLLLLRHASLPLPEFPYGVLMRAHERVLMVAPLGSLGKAAVRRERFLIDRWHERRLDEAGRLVSLCYRGHVDAEINDLYRSPAGARHFIANLIHYPGCGVFQYPASFVAMDPATGDLRGLVLASKVSDGIGHVTQLCTHPVARGTGIGRALLDQTLSALAASGCHTVSLTVTSANRAAVQLYGKLGFRVERRFHAHIWDGL